jgi:signal transduction histidine kinase/DNA-binding response OmpR family regulator
MEKSIIRILIVEDNPADSRLVSEMLTECSTLLFEMAYAGKLNEALKILKEKTFDVVLLDLNLPDSQGLGGVEIITAQEPGVPVIIFTSFDDETLGIQAMRKHAGDYLVKGQINSNILIRSIRYSIERKRAEEALKKAQEKLEIRVQERTAELKGAVETLQNEMAERKQAEKKLKATNALLSLFSQKPSRKEYLDAAVDLIHSWSGCRCVGIRILDDKGYIPYESYVGFSREFWESENRLSVEHDQCACIRVVTSNPDPQDGSVMTPGGSFHCDDTVAFVGRISAEKKARFRGVCIENGFLSLSIVPIRYGEKVFGTIQLADEEKNKLSLSFIKFLESMSGLIGEAVNRFNLEDELRESESRLRFLSSQLLTVQEDERKRIAAELHDDIAAKLATIKFVLEKNLIQTSKINHEVNKALMDIISMVVDTIVSTRRIMINLRPAMIDDLGILATLNWYCREFEQIFSTIHVEKQLNIKEIEIPDNLKIVIFRIVQEGMNNTAKHSGANHVALTLEKINDTVTLLIEDNGRGFELVNGNLESGRFQGFGIVNMKERARLSGGDFAIKSFKEKGTSIKVTWSLKPIEMDYHLRIEPA